MEKYRKALAEYVAVLETSADNTNQAEDRIKYERHLAYAARMFVAIEKNASLKALKKLVEDERHSYGWSFLSGDTGNSAESAFHVFASLIETS